LFTAIETLVIGRPLAIRSSMIALGPVFRAVVDQHQLEVDPVREERLGQLRSGLAETGLFVVTRHGKRHRGDPRLSSRTVANFDTLHPSSSV
jgi:hypothetical protein